MKRSSPAQKKSISVWVFVAGLLIAFCLILVFVGGGGKTSLVLENEQVKQIATVVVSRLDGATSMLIKGVPGNEPPLLHFDRSSNMTGFVTVTDSNYYKLVKKLAVAQATRQVYYLGEWTGDADGSQQIPFQEILKQESYSPASSEYLRFFSPLGASKKNHIVVTDGVFWSASNAQYVVPSGEIAGSIKTWLKSGGRVHLTVLPSAYNFRYKSAISFSRLPAAEHAKSYIRYQAEARPFTVWEFLRPDFSSDLVTKSKEEFPTPLFDFRLGEKLATIRPLSKAFADADDVLDNLAAPELTDFRSVHIAQMIAPKAPIPFECKFNKDLVPEASRTEEKFAVWLKDNIHLDVKCWPVDPFHESAGNNEVSVDAEVPVKIEKVEWMPLPPAGGSQELSANLLLKLPRPSAVRESYLAWVITLRSQRTEKMQTAAALSTEDDSDPEASSRLLHFKGLVEAIADSNNIVGRVILITEWHNR